MYGILSALLRLYEPTTLDSMPAEDRAISVAMDGDPWSSLSFLPFILYIASGAARSHPNDKALAPQDMEWLHSTSHLYI